MQKFYKAIKERFIAIIIIAVACIAALCALIIPHTFAHAEDSDISVTINNTDIVEGASGEGWTYSGGTLTLNQGYSFTFAGDKVAEGTIMNGGTIADGAFSETVIVINTGTINGGTFNGSVTNDTNGTINGGTFKGEVINNYNILDGTFSDTASVINNLYIEKGTFYCSVTNNESAMIGTWSDYGEFYGEVTNKKGAKIYNGVFMKTVTNESGGIIAGGTFSDVGTVTNSGTISGGEFIGDVVNNEGATISDGKFACNEVENSGTISGSAYFYWENSATGAEMTLTNEKTGVIFGVTIDCSVTNYGTIKATDSNGAAVNTKVDGQVDNYGVISGGEFSRWVTNNDGGTVNGGTFSMTLSNSGTVTDANVDYLNNWGGTVSGGTFASINNNNNATISGAIICTVACWNNEGATIENGTYSGDFDNYGTVAGGTFDCATFNSNYSASAITGGTFNSGTLILKCTDSAESLPSGVTIASGVTVEKKHTSGTVYNGKGTHTTGMCIFCKNPIEGETQITENCNVRLEANDNGTHEEVCRVCGNREAEEACTYERVIYYPADCTNTGEAAYECTVCGELKRVNGTIYKEEIPVTDHDFSECAKKDQIGNSTLKSEENGIKTYYKICSMCGISAKGINEDATFTECDAHSYDDSGFCTVCTQGYKQPAVASNGVYQISTAGELYWFAQAINNGIIDITSNAVLTNDITVNTGVIVNGDLNPNQVSVSGFRAWTPIGNNLYYEGSFDGDGHTISGLYVNQSGGFRLGLFGIIGSLAQISNLTISDSYFYGDEAVGGVCGWSYNDSSIADCHVVNSVVSGKNSVGGLVGYSGSAITDSHNGATVKGTEYYVGGLAGFNNDGAISNSYNTGAVSGGDSVGGLVGQTYSNIYCSYNTGSVSGGYAVGGIAGYSYGMIDSCYNHGEVTATTREAGGLLGDGNSEVLNSYNIGRVSDYNGKELSYKLVGGDAKGRIKATNNYIVYDEDKTSAENDEYKLTGGGIFAVDIRNFHNGWVANRLNSNTTAGIWYQNLSDSSSYPVLDRNAGTVYFLGYNGCKAVYSNSSTTSESLSTTSADHSFVDATCTEYRTCSVCGVKDYSAPPTGHSYDYNTATYTWTGTMLCSAVVRCSNCNYGSVGEMGSSTSTVTIPATCTTSGEEVFTVTFTNTNFATQTKTITLDPIGHRWSDTWVSNGNDTHILTCLNDSSHAQTESCVGGTATCTSPAVCSTCGGYHGEKNKTNHTDTYEWKYDDYKCSAQYLCCGEYYKAETDHTYSGGKCSVCGYTCTHLNNTSGTAATCTKKAVCEICGQEYGEKNSSNHTGAGENVTTATTHKKIYSCCQAVISAEENHSFVSGVCSVCGYGCTHTGGTAYCNIQAVCEICTHPYGELKADNHSGSAEWICTAEKHEKVYTCCAVVTVSVEEHTFADGKCTVCGYTCVHDGGLATCTEKAECVYCGEEYGDLKAHDYSVAAHDSTCHYNKCADCGAIDVSSKVAHSGGTATCMLQAACSTCGAYYGKVDENNHSYGEWVSVGDGTHIKTCAYNAGHTQIEKCSGGAATCANKAVCSTCGGEYGEKDSTNHVGGTELLYVQAATCTEGGYTGSTHCKGCGAELKAGEFIARTGHDYKYTSNGDGSHTGVCANDSTHTVKLLCTGGKATCTTKAVCETCGKEYGEFSTSNHTGKTEWITTEYKHKQVYTCCGAVTVAETDHTFVGGVCSICGYTCAHPKAIPATCTDKAECEVCGEAYGAVNSSNHTGVLKYVTTATTHKQVYTCCGAVVGEEENHSFVNGVCSVCGYGCTHTGGTAYCNKQAVCSTCGHSYGELNPDNHSEGAVWYNSAEKHEQVYTCCGTVKVSLTAHTFKNGTCTVCGYICAHNGGTATCTSPATCTYCGEAYGEVDKTNHTGLKKWTSTEYKHEQTYICCGAVSSAEADHIFNEGKCTICKYTCAHPKAIPATCTDKAVCEVCGEAYGDVNSSNHTGVLKYVTTATTHKQVYTCCGAVVGEEENHSFVNGVCSVCGYGCTHTGGTAYCNKQAVCSTCGHSYGELNPDNHSEGAVWYNSAEKHEQVYTCCGTVKVSLTAHTFKNGTCTVCGYICAHNGGTATCTSPATCTYCGEAYGEVDKTNHTGGEATCIRKAVCSRCGAEYGDLNPDNHTGVLEYVQTESTHGLEYSCCGVKVGTEEKHSFESGVCSICGYGCDHTGGTAYCNIQAVCEKCGHSYGDLNPDNHSGAATWQSTAQSHDKLYSCCKTVAISAAAHTFKDGVCTECGYSCTHTGGKATCSAKAVCSVCGEQYGEIDPDNHSGNVVVKNQKASSCVEEGYTGDTYCADCGEKLAEGSVIAKSDHDYSYWMANGNDTHIRICKNDSSHKDEALCHGGTATCVEQAICKYCGAHYGKLADHTFTAEIAEDKYLVSAATCTAKAVYYKSCAVCGLAGEETFESGDFASHTVGEWEVTKQATCTQEGSRTSTCTVCGATIETEAIPATGHDYSVTKYDENGHWNECSVCGAATAAEAHSYDDDKDTTCNVCGAVREVSPEQPVDDNEGGLPVWAIVLIAVGGVAIVGAAAFTIVWFVRKR